MLNLSLIELKAVANIRDIKGYENMSKDELLSTLKASECENNFDKTRIEEIRKKFNDSRHKFCKSKMNKIRRNFSAPKIKEIEKNLLELKKKSF